MNLITGFSNVVPQKIKLFFSSYPSTSWMFVAWFEVLHSGPCNLQLYLAHMNFFFPFYQMLSGFFWEDCSRLTELSACMSTFPTRANKYSLDAAPSFWNWCFLSPAGPGASFPCPHVALQLHSQGPAEAQIRGAGWLPRAVSAGWRGWEEAWGGGQFSWKMLDSVCQHRASILRAHVHLLSCNYLGSLCLACKLRISFCTNDLWGALCAWPWAADLLEHKGCSQGENLAIFSHWEKTWWVLVIKLCCVSPRKDSCIAC